MAIRSIFIILSILLCCGGVSAQRLSLDTTVIHYGRILQDSDGERSVVFRNTGDAPLVIMHVKSSCGCLLGRAEPDFLLPGQSGRIIARYDTSRRGRFTKYLTIACNDPQQEIYRIKIRGVVFPDIQRIHNLFTTF